MSERFPRTNLAEVEEIERELILHGLFYRGLNHQIVGPTGGGKTVLATGLSLEALRLGEVPAHVDQEIGGPGVRSLYVAHGATAEELAALHYLEFPEPTLAEARELAESILAEGETFAIFDKKPDFLRSMGLAENSNDDQSSFYGELFDPLRDKVTTVMIAPTGHRYSEQSDQGRRARGGSEASFKQDVVWVLKVDQPFDRQRIGRITLTCDKDRWGMIGVGHTVSFRIGGDGQGRIIFEEDGSGFEADSREAKANDLLEWLTGQAVMAGRKVAPDADHKTTQKALLDWLDANLPESRGSRQDRIDAIHAATARYPSEDRLVATDTGKRPGGRASYLYHFEAGR